MTEPVVHRVVPDIQADDVGAAIAFYELIGLRTVMDNEWIVTLASPTATSAQLSVLRADPSGLRPGISIEVGEVDAVHERLVEASVEVVYPLTNEPWSVRRFFVRSPDGTIVNILSHTG